MGPTLDRVEKLSRGGKYHEWSAQIRAQLIELDLHDWLTRDANPQNAEDVKKAMKCKARLQLSVQGCLLVVAKEWFCLILVGG